MENILTIFENNHIDPPWAYLFVFALDAGLILAFLFCVREVARAKKAARDAERATRSTASLFEGMRFIAGVVEYAQGENAAVSVTVTQGGTEHQTKNGKYHRWEENGRKTLARPFYVKHASGARIRVEPPEDVLLVDKLDQKEWKARDERRLRAEIVPGEHAVVEGVLRRERDPEAIDANVGYRQAASEGWVMKPRRNAGMQISTEDLSRRHTLRMKAFYTSMAWLFVAGSIAQVPLLTYRARVLLGHNVVAEYAGKSTYTTRNSKGQVSTHYVAKVWHETEKSKRDYIDAEIDSSDHAAAPNSPQKIWIRQVWAFEDATALGRGSSISFFMWLLSTFVQTIGILSVGASHRYRRWYEGKVVEQKNGELPLPTLEAFRADEKPKKKKKA